MTGVQTCALPILDVRLSLEEVNKINELIERDTAKAITQEKVGETTLEYCPTCHSLMLTGDTFCRKCGQRLDADNIKL